MSIVRRLRHFYLARFSRPASDREIYRHIGRAKVRSILEIGLGSVSRAINMLELAAGHAEGELRYSAIDYFDARQVEHGAPLPIKEAHRALKPTGAQVRLLPGDAFSVLGRQANALGAYDLVLIASEYQNDSLERAWFYFPRIVHEKSRVLLETLDPESGAVGYRAVDRGEISNLALPQGRRAA